MGVSASRLPAIIVKGSLTMEQSSLNLGGTFPLSRLTPRHVLEPPPTLGRREPGGLFIFFSASNGARTDFTYLLQVVASNAPLFTTQAILEYTR